MPHNLILALQGHLSWPWPRIICQGEPGNDYSVCVSRLTVLNEAKWIRQLDSIITSSSTSSSTDRQEAGADDSLFNTSSRDVFFKAAHQTENMIIRYGVTTVMTSLSLPVLCCTCWRRVTWMCAPVTGARTEARCATQLTFR